jgi:cyclohexyl-isocyanide hydratase
MSEVVQIRRSAARPRIEKGRLDAAKHHILYPLAKSTLFLTFLPDGKLIKWTYQPENFMTQQIEPKVAGLLLFPNMTQLDLTGPLEVLGRLPGWRAEIVAPTLEPVRTDKGLVIQPDADISTASEYELFVVPGGPGTDDAMLVPEIVNFVREKSNAAAFIFGICTGSLLLGAAGLLQGRRAGGHWQARDLLSQFGAIPSDDRMTIDGNIYTSGGVTAGIDMALKVAAAVAGDEIAQQIQLQIEYDPEPPFEAGTPFVAPPKIVEQARVANAARRAIRVAAVEKAASRLKAQLSGL